MVNVLVMPPPSTLTAHPLEPPLGAVMAQGPITYGLPGVPFPAVTQGHPVAEPGAVKSVSEVILMAPCCEAPAGPAARDATGAPRHDQGCDGKKDKTSHQARSFGTKTHPGTTGL